MAASGVGVAVAVLVHVAHERQIPSVVAGELGLILLDLGQCRVADAERLGDLVGLGGLLLRSLVEHVEVDGDFLGVSAMTIPSRQLK